MLVRGITSAAVAIVIAGAAASTPQADAQQAPIPATPAAPVQGPAPPPAAALKHVPKGTAVVIELTQTMRSDDEQPGATFSLRLAEPVVVDGVFVLPAGLIGQGEVIDARKGGLGGAAGKLVLAARSLIYGDRQIPLQALKLSGSGKSHVAGSFAAEVLGGSRSGAAGLLIQGDGIVLEPGTRAEAEIGGDLDLPVLGYAPAPSGGSAVVPPSQRMGVATSGPIPPPPPGKGQIVFYRPSSIFGAALSYSVHEGDAKLGHLGMGHYRIVAAEPGKHTYDMHSAFGDALTLEVEAGETYYVKQGFGVGYVRGNPILEPSDEAAFNRIVAKLRRED